MPSVSDRGNRLALTFGPRDAGRPVANAEKAVAVAEARLTRSHAEVDAATDILEGRTALGEGREVRALHESDVKDVKTPEFKVTGGGKPDALAEVKAIGSDTGAVGKRAIRDNFGDAASQISDQAARTGEKGGLVRLDGGTKPLPGTNEEMRAAIEDKWRQSVNANPKRSGDIGWIDIVDTGPAGPRRLLLKVDGRTVTIDVAGTTRP